LATAATLGLRWRAFVERRKGQKIEAVKSHLWPCANEVQAIAQSGGTANSDMRRVAVLSAGNGQRLTTARVAELMECMLKFVSK
jgi:hypothetical protein